MRLHNLLLVAAFVTLSSQAGEFVINEREIDITGRYLLVPVNKKISPQAFKGEEKAMQQQLDVTVDGVLVHSPSVNLAHSEDDMSRSSRFME